MRISYALTLALSALSLAGCGACLQEPVADAGPRPPAGHDAGDSDAGELADAGFDAGHPEADAGFDAGDQEEEDAGFDAGEGDLDAGFDAGDEDAGVPVLVCAEGDDVVEPEPVPDVLITTLADVVDAGDGVLSVREALAQLESGIIPAGSVIGFDPSLSGTVALSSALLVRRSVTLLGHDADADGEPDIWLEHNSNAALLRIRPSTPGSVRVRWLGFRGSSYLLGSESETVLDVHVEHCAFADTNGDGGGASAITVRSDLLSPESSGSVSLVVRHSTFRNVHRGIAMSGSHSGDFSVFIESSVFESAALGDQTLMFRVLAQATIANTIIAGPTSGEAIYFRDVQDARLVNTTVATSSATPRLRHRNSSVHLHNTVLTGPGADCSIDTSSNDVTAHHSFIGATDGCTFTGDANITGTVASPADPQLSPFGDYGSAKQSAPPALGSPLVDSGDNALAVWRDGTQLLDDVRGLGFPRRCDGDGDGVRTVDIGATELIPAE